LDQLSLVFDGVRLRGVADGVVDAGEDLPLGLETESRAFSLI
jgi:hypothetical protein